MPTQAILENQAIILHPELASRWVHGAGQTLPRHSWEQMRRFLAGHDVLYGPTAQAELCAQFGHFLEREPSLRPPTLQGFRDDWGVQRRQVLRDANDQLALELRSLDSGRIARHHRERTKDIGHLAAMARSGHAVCVAALVDAAVELDQVLFLGETHGRDQHDNVKVLRGVCQRAGPRLTSKRVVRVLLDGIAATPNDGPIDFARVTKNYADVDRELFDRCEWFGIEPEETELLTVCQQLTTIARSRAEFRAAVLGFIGYVEQNQEYRALLRDALTKPDFGAFLGRLRACVLTGEASRLQDGAGGDARARSVIPTDLATELGTLASYIEFQDHSAIRMDAHVAWTRTIEAVAARPRASTETVTVVVLCGMNHLLMRSRGAVPVHAMLAPDATMALCLTSDAQPDATIRQFNGSSNYVTTIPVAWVDEYAKQVKQTDEGIAKINRPAKPT